MNDRTEAPRSRGKTDSVNIRMTPETKALVLRVSEKKSMSLSAYVHDLITQNLIMLGLIDFGDGL